MIPIVSLKTEIYLDSKPSNLSPEMTLCMNVSTLVSVSLVSDR